MKSIDRILVKKIYPFKKIILEMLFFLIALIFSVFAFIYLLTDSYITKTPTDAFQELFWTMWQQLIHFNVSIDPKIALNEAFIANGHVTVYFLPLPALVRGMLSLFHWEASGTTSMVLAATIFSFFSGQLYLLMLKILLPNNMIVPSKIKIAWLAFFVLGSPIIIALSRSDMYWEAIIWGAAISMAAFYFSVSILFTKKFMHLIYFSIIGGLGLFARPNVTIMIIVLFSLTWGILFSRLKKIGSYKKSELFSVLFIFVFFVISLGCLNYARWGNPIVFGSLTKNISYLENPSRLLNYVTHGGENMNRIPQAISYYFVPSLDNFSSNSPFITPGFHIYFPNLAKNFDYVDPPFPLLVASPIFTLFGLSGFFIFIYALLKNETKFISFLPVAIAGWIPTLILLPLAAEAMRYRGDILPPLVFFSIYFIVVFINKLYSLKNEHPKKIVFFIKQPVCHVMLVCLLTGIAFYLSFVSAVMVRQFIFNGASSIAKAFPFLFSETTTNKQVFSVSYKPKNRVVIQHSENAVLNHAE